MTTWFDFEQGLKFDESGKIVNIYKENDTQTPKNDQKNTKNAQILPKTILDIIKWKKDNRFVIKDFILPQTVNMMFSPPSTYKSLITLDLALCVAAGEPWLNLETKRGKVLICDKENSIKDIRDRVVSLVNGHNWDKKKLRKMHANILIREGMLDDQHFIGGLHDYVKENGVCLVVFDTLRRFSPFEENSSDDMNKLYTAFQKIINSTNTAILFLHHTNKDESSYRGSVDVLGQVDTAYRVSRKKLQNTFCIECEKNRSGEIDKIQGQIEWDKEKEITTIKREDVEVDKEKQDNALKWIKLRVWMLQKISEICPMAGNTFMRSQLAIALDADNLDKIKEEQTSRRTMDRLLANLVLRKYLAQTGKKGEYRRNFGNNSGVFEPLGGKIDV